MTRWMLLMSYIFWILNCSTTIYKKDYLPVRLDYVEESLPNASDRDILEKYKTYSNEVLVYYENSLYSVPFECIPLSHKLETIRYKRNRNYEIKREIDYIAWLESLKKKKEGRDSLDSIDLPKVDLSVPKPPTATIEGGPLPVKKLPKHKCVPIPNTRNFAIPTMKGNVKIYYMNSVRVVPSNNIYIERTSHDFRKTDFYN